MPLIVSVMGTSHDEFARLVEGVAPRDEVAALELNVSCPNVESGLVVGESPDETRSLLELLRPLTEKPLIVKLTPNVPPGADRRRGGGGRRRRRLADQHPARRGDRSGRPGRPGSARSGAGSPARRSGRSRLSQVREVAAAVSIPVIGMGGIATGRHAADLISAGAQVVAVGTESFRDPAAGSRIAAELADGVTAERPPRSPHRRNFFSTDPTKPLSRVGSRGYTAAP